MTLRAQQEAGAERQFVHVDGDTPVAQCWGSLCGGCILENETSTMAARPLLGMGIIGACSIGCRQPAKGPEQKGQRARRGQDVAEMKGARISRPNLELSAGVLANLPSLLAVAP